MQVAPCRRAERPFGRPIPSGLPRDRRAQRRRNPKGTGGLRPGTAAIAVVAASELLSDALASLSSSFLVRHSKDPCARPHPTCADLP